MSLTPNGYNATSLQTLIEDMTSNYQNSFGPLIDTSSDSALGIWMGVTAIEISNVFSDLKEIYSNMNPQTSEGRMLENISLFGGIVRKGLSKSTGVVDFTGINGTVIPLGTVVLVSADTTRRFVTVTDEIIPSGGTIRIRIEAEVEGAIQAPTGTIDTLETPIVGVTSLTNPRDVSIGAGAVETEDALRQRRSNTLSMGGNGTAAAISAAISQIPSVTTVRVISNTTSFWQEKGNTGTFRPPNSVEVVVENGDEDDIIEALGITVSATSEMFGDLTAFYSDITGNQHQVRYSRPSEIDIYIDVVYTIYSEENFPEDGEAQIAQAIEEWGQVEYQLGVDVLVDRITVPCFDVSGIASVTITVGTTPVTTGDDIPIELYEKAVVSVSNITVTQ